VVSFHFTFLKFSALNLNAWNVHTDVTTFAQVLVLVLVLESEVLVLVLILGEKSLLTSLRDGKVQKNMDRLVPRTCPWAENLKKQENI